jgi:hypothetical protein
MALCEYCCITDAIDRRSSNDIVSCKHRPRSPRWKGQGQLFDEFRTQEGNAGQPDPRPALRHAPASDLVAVGGRVFVALVAKTGGKTGSDAKCLLSWGRKGDESVRTGRQIETPSRDGIQLINPEINGDECI